VVIRAMVRDLNLPAEVVVAPTVREADGLALSSRNSYLTPEQRAVAPAIYRGLTAAKALFDDGERDAEALRRAVRAAIEAEPQMSIDYVSVADPETLRELAQVASQALASTAVRLGTTRLIDNLLLG
jgi:pantoate--beta-alanine ligase